mmetsp:Transcript_81799/g.213351  ORF Transcript_81799/g.213351 Transcript_81799/m.213351 type:complete len:216 (-) Transcript_81799:238-885(-)
MILCNNSCAGKARDAEPNNAATTLLHLSSTEARSTSIRLHGKFVSSSARRLIPFCVPIAPKAWAPLEPGRNRVARRNAQRCEATTDAGPASDTRRQSSSRRELISPNSKISVTSPNARAHDASRVQGNPCGRSSAMLATSNKRNKQRGTAGEDDALLSSDKLKAASLVAKTMSQAASKQVSAQETHRSTHPTKSCRKPLKLSTMSASTADPSTLS